MAATPQIASLLGRRGRLALDDVLAALVVDGHLSADDAKQLRMGRRAGGSSIELNPLVVIANAKFVNQRDPGRPLSLEGLTEWLAAQADLPYLKIDPMKINVAAVTQVVSHAYAQRHRILPVAVTTGEVTFATAEPFDNTWAKDLAQMLRRDVHRVVCSPIDINRYLQEFYGVQRSIQLAKDAKSQSGYDPSAILNFEQLAGAWQSRRSGRGRSARRAYRGLAAAIRVRTARIGYPPGTTPRSRSHAFSHRRRDAQSIRVAAAGDDGGDLAHQDPCAHGRGREAASAGWPHQDALIFRTRSGIAYLQHADRVRRKAGDAYFRPGHRGEGFFATRFFAVGRYLVAQHGGASAWHRAGDRPYRLGQNHDALFDAQTLGHT